LCIRSHYDCDHPEYLNYQGNYGIILKKSGDTEKARDSLQQAWEGLNVRGHIIVIFFAWFDRFPHYTVFVALDFRQHTFHHTSSKGGFFPSIPG
jgi:hypothetical protein